MASWWDALDVGSVLRFLDASDAILIEQALVDQGGTVIGTVDLRNYIDVTDGLFTAAGTEAWLVFVDSHGVEQQRFSCVLSEDLTADTAFHIGGNSLEVGVGMVSQVDRLFVIGGPTYAKVAGAGTVT